MEYGKEVKVSVSIIVAPWQILDERREEREEKREKRTSRLSLVVYQFGILQAINCATFERPVVCGCPTAGSTP